MLENSLTKGHRYPPYPYIAVQDLTAQKLPIASLGTRFVFTDSHVRARYFDRISTQ